MTGSDYCRTLTLMKMSDHMALDMDTGELRIISGWDSDENDRKKRLPGKTGAAFL